MSNQQNETEFDLEAHYRHPDYPGVAWYISGYYLDSREEWEFFGEEGEEEDESKWDFNTWEEEDRSQVYAIMVGDDRRFLFSTDDLIKIAETDFCRECGQIGCGCVVYE